jgi:hypothetical protein
MILSYGKIDLSFVLNGLRHLVEVGDLPYGQSPFDSEEGLSTMKEGLAIFNDYVQDNEDREDMIRRGLCWLLNQDDETLIEYLLKGRMPFPNKDAEQHRRYLEMIWENTFASWRVENFDSDEYDVLGIPK